MYRRITAVKLSEVVEDFLKVKGFDHYGLFVQDYGGPVGFRVVGRHPEALDWLIIPKQQRVRRRFYTGMGWISQSAMGEPDTGNRSFIGGVPAA